MSRGEKRLRIGVIFIQNALGESVIGLESFYAIKQIYDCELIIFAKSTLQNLLRHCEFVDEVRECTKEAIDSARCDYAILSNAKTMFINFALSTNAKKIICATKFRSLISPRCRTVPIYMGKRYYHYDEREILLAYARAINPKRYDARIGGIDLANAKIACGSENTAKAREFLTTELAKRAKLDSMELDSSKRESMGLDSRALDSRLESLESKHSPRYLVMINPFNNACSYSLSLRGFLRLIERVASRGDCVPLVMTFAKVHARFMEALAQYCPKRDSSPESTLESKALNTHKFTAPPLPRQNLA